jgi:hypothetical protein
VRFTLASISFALGALVTCIVACGEEGARQCRVGADCASGMCSAEGVCIADSNANPPGTSGGPSNGTGDAGAQGDASTPIDAALPGCTANKDGIITREEVPIQAGLHATFRIAKDEDVSTAGTPIANNRRAWNFTKALASDTSVLVETLALTGKWYAPKFGGASYAAKLREGTDLVGVFETSPASLTLRGVVSPDDGLYRTELKNDPPVSTLTFPLQLGKTWNSDTTVSGVANGAAVAYTEKYASQVDAAGELETPLGKFEVLRVRIVLTRTVGLLVTTVRTFAFVTECYGTIAAITSRDNESDVEFTRAVELRRIAP